MNKDTLLAFIQRILENGSDLKSGMAINQLLTILESQNVDPSMIKLVRSTLEGIPEAKEAARSEVLTEEMLQIAFRRAEDRRRREEEAARQGRC